MEAVLLVVVVIGGVFFGIVYSIFMSIERDDTPPHQQPPRRNSTNHNSRPTNSETPPMRFGDENIYRDEWREFRHLSERERDRLLRGKIQRFWEKALEYSIKYIEQKDIDSLREFVYNIWNTRDKVESARDLHILIDCIVDRLYPYRNDSNYYYDTIIEFCYLDLSNAENYINVAKKYAVWRTPTKLAILLEKAQRYDEAIELCDFCIANGIPDHGYNNFKERKEHLLKKKGIK